MTEMEAKDLFGLTEEEAHKMFGKREETSTKEKCNDAARAIINHPSHYNAGEIECIDAIESATAGLNGYEGFLVGNAIKYLWRWKHKGGLQDLMKCRWYLDKLIAAPDGDHAN